MPFRIGADASCTDGACGQVSRIILNPVNREVTHLAVDPKHRHGPGRLVPVDLVNAMTGQIRLRCTLAEFQTFRAAQEAQPVRDLDPTGHDNAPKRVNWAVWMQMARDPGKSEAPQQVWVDYVPSGQVDTPRPDRLCDRRRDRASPGARRGTWRPPGSPRAPPEGAHAGPQGSGHPDRRRDEDRDSAYPSQPHQTPGERPAARGHRSPRGATCTRTTRTPVRREPPGPRRSEDKLWAINPKRSQEPRRREADQRPDEPTD
jgi:hypothetical protein